MIGQEQSRTRYNIPLLRMELSTFQGQDISRSTLPVHLWVELVSYYLKARVDVWFEGLIRGNETLISWEDFSQFICLFA